jgi:hypothetical protein
MVFNRPHLLLVRSSAGMLDEWAKRPKRTPKKKAATPAPAKGTASADGDDGDGDGDAESGASTAMQEASAAARKAIEEIVASGLPRPRGFVRGPPLVTPQSMAAAAPAERGSKAQASAEEDVEDDDEFEAEIGDLEDDGEDGDEGPLSDADVAEFEAALEAATRKAKAASQDERESIIARIEARWAARSGGGGEKSPAGIARAKRRANNAGKGAQSRERREREKLHSPWLSAPWARAQAKPKKPAPPSE